MEESESFKIAFTGKAIAKNTIYNLLGYGIPFFFALFTIPFLIRGLGIERFGILNLAWIVIGYFSFFDFGIGKGLTKIIAERIGLNQTEHISKIFWTSLSLMLSTSFLATIIISFFVPTLVKIFGISDEMQQETLNTFYILAVAIPIVSTTAGLRGVLEAYQKFGIVNVMRVFLGVFTFLGPLLVLIFVNSLFWIVLFLVLLRIIVWILYLTQCFRVNKSIRNEIVFDFSTIKPVLKFSIWITIANIVGPLIIYSDRFLIGALVSAAAIAYYATPYEIVSKLLIIPSALSMVLFPVFSASFFSNPETSKKIFLRGAKFIFIILYPIIFFIVMFSHEIIELWINKDFAAKSSFPMQLLAIGILMNSISLIPNNFLQGIGKPKIPTLINLMELPIYLFVMWYSVQTSGIRGAAIAYLVMASIDAALMYTMANKFFTIKYESKLTLFNLSLLLSFLLLPFFIRSVYLKVAIIFLFLIFFISITWRYYLSTEEKFFLFSKFRTKIRNV